MTVSRWRKIKSGGISCLCLACAVLVVSPLGLVFFHLLREGATSVNWGFFTNLPKPPGELGGGLANAIVGTFELLGIASIIGVPTGVLGGVYLTEYGAVRVNWFLRFVCDILDGVPSILWRVVAYDWGLALEF